MRLLIIGPMASGKSTIGLKLANRLNLDFVDTDQQVEDRAGAEISWIFDIEGESGFRIREEEVLKEVCLNDEIVISTGGGIIIEKNNRKLISESGVVIYLEVSIQTQLERTLMDKSRPLLDSKDKEQTLKNLKKQRTPLYEEIANITIEAGDRSNNQVVEEILKLL
jgi:shikimate kinase|tara:strand:- start:2563 stop:3060 length:498 start_codon:yes stop_codon:yes gene_type:complete